MFLSLCCPFCSICKFNKSWSCLQLLLIGKQGRLRVFIVFISYIVTANLMTKARSSVSKSWYCFMSSLELRIPRCGMLYYLLLQQQSLILDLWGWLNSTPYVFLLCYPIQHILFNYFYQCYFRFSSISFHSLNLNQITFSLVHWSLSFAHNLPISSNSSFSFHILELS